MDIRNVDLNLLVALDALLAERSVSRAAARLHLSQPATSALLARLRELFGDPLLLRSARGMLPTPRALELLGPVKQVLDEIDAIVRPRTAFDPASAVHTFTLSASDYVEYALLPTLVDFLEREAPGVRLAVRPLDLQTVAKQMEIGEVDLCITGLQNAPEGLHQQALYTERIVSVVRRRHPGVGVRLTLEKFCSLEHILVSVRGSGFSARIDDALAKLGRKRRARLAVPHFLLVPEIVARSDMISALPERLARGYANKLRIFEPPLAIEGFTVGQIWHERNQREPAQLWLREKLLALAQKPPR
ncbi:MAG: LysR family transcriptional regulator [Betaproteobacteria bacterium]|nr:LysR family transcriptional regulator [Betaproteobacteria bacterium]